MDGSSDQTDITLGVNSNAPAGTYNITVNGNNICGDGGSSTYAITVNSLPALNSFNNETICSGENVQIGQDLGGGYSYQWTATPDHVFNKTVARPTVNPTQSTSYTLVVTNLASGCSTSESVQVIVK